MLSSANTLYAPPQMLLRGVSLDYNKPCSLIKLGKLSTGKLSLPLCKGRVDESGERSETDDEGIEGDSYDDHLNSRSFNFLALLKVCRDRLGSSPSGGLSSSGSLSNLCQSGSGNGNQTAADNHYKAVVRALVAETLELSTFLEKVAQGTHELRAPRSSSRSSGGSNSDGGSGESLEGLHFTVWARLWVQVIRDLRNGVKLKKVDSFDSSGRGCPPIEYELTPYEILMDDIRSRRYKLKQVMVDGSLPQRVKRDAHELILEFIRGRPPLRKAADRVLAPPPEKLLPPIEALMESIRTQNPQNLRPTKTIVRSSVRKESLRHRQAPRRQTSHEMTSDRSSASGRSSSTPASKKSADIPDVTSSTSTKNSTSGGQNDSLQSQSTPQRRLIKADLDALYGNDKDDDSDDDHLQLQVTKDSDGTCYYGHICPEHTQSEPTTPWKTRTDLLCDSSSNVDNRRRHTICNPDMTEEHGALMITFPLEYTNTLNVYNSLNGPAVSPILARRKQNLPRSMSKSMLQEEFFQSNQWQTAMECLSLNLEEVVHIRNVLTKAELESLPVDCSTKEDVLKGKVCFLCLKARFSLFGPWGNTCKLCKRMVCAKCCSKMRIPTEHFANIPVSTLSPLLSPTREEDSPTNTPGKSPSPLHPSGVGGVGGSCHSLMGKGRKNSVGSAPTSPSLSRKSDDSGQRSISPGGLLDGDDLRDRISPDGQSGPYSLPTVSSISLSLQALKRRGFGRKKEEGKTERLMGQLMVVCHDCKAMVLQIIRTSRVNKGQHLRANMTLDLPQLHQLA
ncbi:Protein spire 1 [Folsomia candida]|uniref:Protein spire 1 n=1 Tax=Folsomia candida TaxID=158441 RepID=A0A226F3K8_FOLCA|nr:Protein spire 1 [Folsomia candida]